MKPRYFVLSISALWFAVSFAGPFLQAQEVKPASLTIQAIPGETSPQQRVVFTNTGVSDLTLTISISGPFSVPKNKCGHPVKQNLHCDVWVTYSPQEIGTDTGTLTFTFNDQSVSVPLTGNGLNLLATSTRLQLTREGELKTTVSVANGYQVPDGEQVTVFCTAVSGPDKGYEVNGSADLSDGKADVPASIVDVLGGHYMWRCYSAYYGDGEFAGSESGLVTVWSRR
ncbi:MAG: hypothetical protein WBQ43_20290 [Terriglobales bacterium]